MKTSAHSGSSNSWSKMRSTTIVSKNATPNPVMRPVSAASISTWRERTENAGDHRALRAVPAARDRRAHRCSHPKDHEGSGVSPAASAKTPRAWTTTRCSAIRDAGDDPRDLAAAPSGDGVHDRPALRSSSCTSTSRRLCEAWRRLISPFASSRVQSRVALDGCTSSALGELAEVPVAASRDDERTELGERHLVLHVGQRPGGDSDERPRREQHRVGHVRELATHSCSIQQLL